MPDFGPLEISFVGLSVLMILVLGWMSGSPKAAGLFSLWAAGAWALASTGWTQNFEAVPPRIFFVLGPTLILVFVSSFSSLGNCFVRIPIKWLILIQSFRILVELLIHWAAEEGIAPGQLTWPAPWEPSSIGLNLDILAGITALFVGLLANKIPRSILLLWNAIGLSLVLWVVSVAIVSVPGPLQILHPDNTWVARVPFILLPTVLVPIAIGGHLIIFRAILFPPDRVKSIDGNQE